MCGIAHPGRASRTATRGWADSDMERDLHAVRSAFRAIMFMNEGKEDGDWTHSATWWAADSGYAAAQRLVAIFDKATGVLEADYGRA